MEMPQLDVKTKELTKLLTRLCKTEKKQRCICLKHANGLLQVSLGATVEQIEAGGSWPQSVFVDRKWAETLSDHPYDVAIMTLRISRGQIHVRDFSVTCSFDSSIVEDEDEDVLKQQPLNKKSKDLWKNSSARC